MQFMRMLKIPRRYWELMGAIFLSVFLSFWWGIFQSDMLNSICHGSPGRWFMSGLMLPTEVYLYNLRMRMRGAVLPPMEHPTPQEQRNREQYLRRVYGGAFRRLDDIVVVAVDDKTVDSIIKAGLPYPPMRRSVYAELIRILKRLGAKAIGLDLVFATPSPYGAEDDEDLATACREAGNVILACRLITGYVARGAGYEVQYDGPIDALAEAAYEIGLVDAITSPPDEKVRQGVLYTIHQDELIPSLSVLATALFLGIPSGQVAKQLQHKRFWRYNIPILKYRVGTEMTSAAVGQDYGTVLLNYAGPEETFRYVSLSDVLFPEQGEYTIDELKSIFKGKIVLVGDTSIIGKDVLPTPLTQRMPGVEIHANIAQGLLTNNFVHLPTPALTFLFTFVICTLAGIITFILRPLRALPIILFFILALAFLIGYVMFVTRNLWMPFAYTLFGIATNFAIITAYTHLTAERRARQMRDRFGRFVSPAMLHIMVEHPDEALTHPQKMVATLLFTDLRGFTALSERMDAERVVALLDDYFREMTEIIFRYEGTINKFIGDAIFVIFGAPLPMLDHAQRAIQCAVEMQVALDRLRPRLVERGYPELYMRIGIHTGEIVFGEVGKGRQADLTAIGDAVNVASRLEELNKDLGTWVLISETTYELAKDIAVAEPAGTAPIRGRAKPMTVYKLIGLTNGLRIPEPAAKPKLEEVRAASS